MGLSERSSVAIIGPYGFEFCLFIRISISQLDVCTQLAV